ncbi:uncharacterized protein LY89DRAFT_735839 [Mollisia scopiformis]|uniref:Uncharacterized protein n=1 Tax=Mollisia scopiformis TaxID=149040 RepID=A0A194X3Z1_MOLSC|nr:uncharacterized protein LY89DRAFT_735839 [Mollisia scopiformis]KUJ14764.1 hypothetical protein LY89DRAFT_735839 [Mollisia scopiformis]
MEDLIDPALRELATPAKGRQDSVAQQRKSLTTMTISMSPQSVDPRANELLATTESSNTTATSTPSKRANDSDDLDYDSSGSGEIDWNDDNGKRRLAVLDSKIRKFLAPWNKRSKHAHLVPQFNIQIIQSTDPEGTNHNTQSAYDGSGGTSQSSGQAIQAHHEHQAPRSSMTSTLSSLPSNLSDIFSSRERPTDSQSEFSQAQTTATNDPPGGLIACDTCAKQLSGRNFSGWRNHYWAKHNPQEGWYCLFCKVDIDDVDGLLYWRCKRCPKSFLSENEAISHFTTKGLPCYQRGAHWVRLQPWKEHLQGHLQKDYIVDIAVDAEQYRKKCIICQGTFSNEILCKKHICPLTNWKYELTTPLPKCEDHPSLTFVTHEEVNQHVHKEHFGKSKPSSGSCRHNKSQAGSTQGDRSSWCDNQSQNGNNAHALGQQDYGATGAGWDSTHKSTAQESGQPGTIRDPMTDWRGISPGPEVQNPRYPQGLMLGNEGGSSGRSSRRRKLAPRRELGPESDVPPVTTVLTDIVTDDGDPRFLVRKNAPR